MKNRFFINTLLIVQVMFISSCTKENREDIVKTGEKITVIGENFEPDTKTTLSGLSSVWIASDDKVGIYSPQARPTSGGAAGVTNAQFTAVTSTASSVFTGEMYWGTGSHTFYAYYPYAAGSAASSAVPVSLNPAQTQSSGGNSSHVGSLDFMVATPVTGVTPGTAGESAGVSLYYNHLFTLIEFQIKRSSGSGDISELKFTARNKIAFNSGTVNITQTKPAAGVAYSITTNDTKNEVVLTMTSAMTPTSDYATTPKMYLMINPKTETGYITIAIKSGSTYKYVQKLAPTGGFERGKKYIVQIDAATATDYPGNTTTLANMPTFGSVKWAPVNCGYDPANVNGLVYQWHRKYGQFFVSTGATAGTVSLATGNDPANIDAFYTNSTTPYDWCSAQQSSWSSSAEYNPCPTGWRVPTIAELESLYSAGSTWVASGPDSQPGRWVGGNHDTDHAGSIFFPAAGGRSNADGTLQAVGTGGRYWSSDVLSSTEVYRMQFNSSSGLSTVTANQYRSYGFTVRCVQ
ncbi:MAG: FISUMP domain-containing protein [Bacteroidales bacterium]